MFNIFKKWKQHFYNKRQQTYRQYICELSQKNENISQFLDELSTEQVYRARESVYQYVKNKKARAI
jgi:hypothetical protein